MLTHSVELSVFAFSWLIIEICLFRAVDLSFMKQGSNIRLTKRAVALILGAVMLVGIGIGVVFIYYSGPSLLQLFYIGLYTASLALTLLFLWPVHRFIWRVTLAIGGTLLLLVMVLQFSSGFIQNIFMVASLLWVGPVVAKRFPISLKVASAALVLVMAVDIYNIFLSTKTVTSFSDAPLFLNGSIGFFEASLGIGDFFLAFLIISYTQKRFGTILAVVLAGLLTMPRIFLRVIFPELSNVAVPYYIMMVPVTLLVWWVCEQARKPLIHTTPLT